MKIRKTHAAWAIKLWVLTSVFLLPFISGWEIAAWLALGAVFGLVWKVLPEEPADDSVTPLPFADEYRDRQIPRADGDQPRPASEAARSGTPPAT